jgi:signal transduction histidine kinase
MQINQLFTNLIINSIKYKATGTPPLIQISARPASRDEIKSPDTVSEETNYWKIIFSDNGIGFEQQYADRIFELFQRLHSRFEYEGTGIGLAICKKIVQNHKGFIYADGKPGLGATFVIFLPSTR